MGTVSRVCGVSTSCKENTENIYGMLLLVVNWVLKDD